VSPDSEFLISQEIQESEQYQKPYITKESDSNRPSADLARAHVRGTAANGICATRANLHLTCDPRSVRVVDRVDLDAHKRELHTGLD
jgi:electron transfer flavoprotein alpha subunit